MTLDGCGEVRGAGFNLTASTPRHVQPEWPPSTGQEKAQTHLCKALRQLAGLVSLVQQSGAEGCGHTQEGRLQLCVAYQYARTLVQTSRLRRVSNNLCVNEPGRDEPNTGGVALPTLPGAAARAALFGIWGENTGQRTERLKNKYGRRVNS
jgi:hypothetical protein